MTDKKQSIPKHNPTSSTEIKPKEQLLNRWIKPKQLEAELGFSVANQAQMRMDKRIPFVKVGGYCLYDRIEIDLWLESNRVEIVA